MSGKNSNNGVLIFGVLSLVAGLEWLEIRPS